MLFGLEMSPDLFQEKTDQTFEGCKGVTGIADNIVVFGKSEEERELTNTCMKTGLKLIPGKCKISVKHGIKSDPEKTSSLKKFAPATNTRELQIFLRLATYVCPFLVFHIPVTDIPDYPLPSPPPPPSRQPWEMEW